MKIISLHVKNKIILSEKIMRSSSRSGSNYLNVFIILLLAYFIYILPCFITPIKNSYCQKRRPIKQTIREKRVKTVEITKEIRKPAVLPEDITNDLTTVKNYDFSAITQQQNDIKQRISRIKSKIDEYSHIQAVEAKDSVDDEKIAEFVSQYFKNLKTTEGDLLPLVLTSIFTYDNTQGTTKFQKLFKPSSHRYDEAISQTNGMWCAESSAANFSFWTPYPLWGQDFQVSFIENINDKKDYEIMFELLLGNSHVDYSSQINVIQENGKYVAKYSFEKPTRFDRVRVIAVNSKGSNVCISDVTARTPKKLAA